MTASFWALWSRDAHAQDADCAEVKIVIEQKLSLERQAFDAHMVIRNGLDDSALSNVKVELLFKDQEQRDVVATNDPNATGAAFFVRLDNLSGISSLEGSANLAPKATADIRWLLIPAQGAGGDTAEGKLYYVGARVTYTLNGDTSTVEVTPDYVVVRPQPLLRLDYFVPTDVHADDPFTPETEMPEPFTLGVRVANVGAGVASKLQIESAQPKIVENRQGLLIDFSILGGYVGNTITGKSLLLDFGDIAPLSAKMGRWVMQTSLSGRFTEFNASFVHADSLGGAVTSLIKDVVTHKLVRDVRIDLGGHDDVDDFLAEQGDGFRVYDSQGGDTPVFDLSASSMFSPLAGGNLALQFPATQGMVHVKLADPGKGARKPVQVQRSDGKQLLSQNFWLSKSRNADLSWSYFVHIFDSNTPGQYTLVFSDSDTASLTGSAYLDVNGNGVRDAGEMADGNLQVNLKGVDSQGRNVSVQAYSDPQGVFAYSGLAPGRYQLSAAARDGWVNGVWTVGSAGGTSASGLISDIALLAGSNATGYVLSKRKPAGDNGHTASADLSVTMQSSAHDLIAGQSATVTVTARNEGPDASAGVVVQVPVPEGLSQQVATAGLGTFAQGVWTVGALPKSQTATLTLQLKADGLGSETSRTLNLAATGGAQTADPVPSNNQARLSVLVQKDPQSGVDLAQSLPKQARVLVWAECPELSSSSDKGQCAQEKADTARAWLTPRAHRLYVATKLKDWRTALRSGAYNVLWLVGGAQGLDAVARAEIKAAVRRGDALIVEGASGAQLENLSDVLGAVAADQTSGEDRSVTLAGGAALGTKGGAYVLRPSTALPVASYSDSGDVAIAAQGYGNGQALLVGFDLLRTASAPASAWSGYLEQQILAMTPLDRTQPALAGASLGLTLDARNLGAQTASAKSIRLAVNLDSGVTYRNAAPPALASSSASQPTWEWSLSGGQQERVSLDLLMPQVSVATDVKSKLVDAADQSQLAQQLLAVQVLGLDVLVPRIQETLSGVVGATPEQQVRIADARALAVAVAQAQADGKWSEALDALASLQAEVDRLAYTLNQPAVQILQLNVARWFFLLQTRWQPQPEHLPAQIVAISGGDQTAVVGQPFGLPLIAQVLDGYGQPVADATVQFDAPATGSGAHFGSGAATSTVSTDAQGMAHAQSLTANGVVGTYSVSASVAGVGGRANFTLGNVAQTPQQLGLQIVDGQGQSAAVSALFLKPLGVRLVNAQGQPQPGVTVRFAAPSAGISASFETQGTSAVTAEVVTDANGLATSPALRAGARAGSFVVRASADGVAADAVFTLKSVAIPLVLNMQVVDGQGQWAAVSTLFGKPLSVRVVDAQNNPQQGAVVRFELPSVGPSAQFEGTAESTGQMATDANGVASTPALRANGWPGTYQIRAWLASDASISQSFSLINTAATVPAPVFTATTPTGTGQMTATVSGGGASCAFNPGATKLMPASGLEPVLGQIQLPHGVFDFELVNCTPGGEVTITTTWPDLRGITGYLKYGMTPVSLGGKVWYPPANLQMLGNTITYTIRDGGWGDDDLLANGVIRDPGGPVIAATPPATALTPIPMLNARALALLSLVMAAGAALALRRRSRSA